MIIELDRKKFRKRIWLLGICMVLFGFISILSLIMLLNKYESDFKVQLLVFLSIILFTVFAYLFTCFYPIGKLKEVIIYKDGLLNDFSKPFNRSKNLKVKNIISIKIWSSEKGVIQYRIITTRHNTKRKRLANQLKGNHIYMTDFLVDTDELKKLVSIIQADINQKI